MPTACFRIFEPLTALRGGALLLLASVLIFAAASVSGQEQTIYGELDDAKPTLDGGEHYERHEFELEAGDQIVAEVFSQAFDTFIAVVSPSGQDVQNDDWSQDPERSRVALNADEAGTWTVLVTSFSAGEVGAYTLTVTINGPDVLDDGTIKPRDVVVPDGQRIVFQETGHLGTQSTRSPVRGEPYDTWNVPVEAGQRLTVTMTSEDLDSFLAVFPPEMEPIRNDDGASDIDAQIVMTAEAAGTMTVHAASYDVDAVGAYQLVVTVADSAPVPTEPVTRTVIDTEARLDRDDKVRDEGQRVDRYDVEAAAGERIRIDMTSEVVDPHLFLVSPSGRSWENDDFEARIDRSVLEVTADEDGTYRVTASSFAAGEAGDYRIVVTVTTPAAGGAVVPDSALSSGQQDLPPSGVLPGSPAMPPATTLQPEGDPEAVYQASGQLGDADDEVAPTREFFDVHRFQAVPGQRYRVVLASEAFDTYLEVTSPSGMIWENDDDGDDANQSSLQFEAEEAGLYTIKATSFYPQEKGAYVLTVTLSE